MGSWTTGQATIFAQATDPGAVGAGAIWSDTDAETIFRRDDDNAGWTSIADTSIGLGAHTWTGDQTHGDNINATFGTGGDADIDYNGTDMTINPKVVGTGVIQLPGRIQGMESGVGFAKMELLASHRATGTEATFDFTGLNIDLDAEYSELIVKFGGDCTATLALELTLNDDVLGYRFDKLSQITTTLAGAAAANQASWIVASTTVIPAGRFTQFTAKIKFQGVNADSFFCQSWVGASPTGQEWISGDADIGGAGSTITSLAIDTSTSTWKAGTQIDLYGVKL